jgi:hypothetical protein
VWVGEESNLEEIGRPPQERRSFKAKDIDEIKSQEDRESVNGQVQEHDAQAGHDAALHNFREGAGVRSGLARCGGAPARDCPRLSYRAARPWSPRCRLPPRRSPRS